MKACCGNYEKIDAITLNVSHGDQTIPLNLCPEILRGKPLDGSLVTKIEKDETIAPGQQEMY